VVHPRSGEAVTGCPGLGHLVLVNVPGVADDRARPDGETRGPVRPWMSKAGPR
jgi:hypothetical protein